MHRTAMCGKTLCCIKVPVWLRVHLTFSTNRGLSVIGMNAACYHSYAPVFFVPPSWHMECIGDLRSLESNPSSLLHLMYMWLNWRLYLFLQFQQSYWGVGWGEEIGAREKKIHFTEFSAFRCHSEIDLRLLEPCIVGRGHMSMCTCP